MQINLTFPQVRAAARRVIAKYGTEYRYYDHNDPAEGCKNINVAGVQGNTNGVGCIVGEIMRDLGVTIPESGAIGGIVLNGELSFHGEPVTVSEKALAFLMGAQKTQDSMDSWGEAFANGIVQAKTV